VPEPPGSQRVTLGEAILDLAQGTLTRQGEVVPLRSKSFRLLCELARQPGRVVPKSQLLDAVWPDVIVTEVSLNQAVRDIRKALGDEAGQILRTVVRRGFMLCPTDRPRPPKPDGLGPSGHLASRPRIALLPLVNRTGRAELGPILDGLVEEVTAGLARFRNLTVLARHSATFAAAEPGLSLTDLGARLRANYLVEGSAKLVGDHLVLAWALNDACSGEILWGESFPCEGSSWLTLQDLIPRRIVQRLFNSIEEAGHRSSLSRNAATRRAPTPERWRSLPPRSKPTPRSEWPIASMAWLTSLSMATRWPLAR
jgi:TolB-like protein